MLLCLGYSFCDYFERVVVEHLPMTWRHGPDESADGWCHVIWLPVDLVCQAVFGCGLGLFERWGLAVLFWVFRHCLLVEVDVPHMVVAHLVDEPLALA